MTDPGLGIEEQDLLDAAKLFQSFQATFTARDFAGLVQIQAHGLEEEQANEILLGLVERGQLREIGPGVYAVPATAAAAPAPDMVCPKCSTEYPVPAPEECDYCGVALSPGPVGGKAGA